MTKIHLGFNWLALIIVILGVVLGAFSSAEIAVSVALFGAPPYVTVIALGFLRKNIFAAALAVGANCFAALIFGAAGAFTLTGLGGLVMLFPFFLAAFSLSVMNVLVLVHSARIASKDA